MSNWRIWGWFLLAVSCIHVWHIEPALANKKESKNDVVYPPLKDFAQALHILLTKSVDKVINAKTLIESGVQGMVKGSGDKHAAYLTREELLELEGTTNGQFWGLGIEVALENGEVHVVAPIEGGPAQKAGIRSGDQIVKINGEKVEGLNFSDIRTRLQGRRGSKVSLMILRGKETKQFDVIRDQVKLVAVRHHLLGDGIIVIKVSQFQRGITQKIRKIMLDNQGKISGIIMILEDNPGGIYEEAVLLSNLFLVRGNIVYSIDRNGQKNVERASRPHTIGKNIPVVLLVNKGSASASEIFMGAMQDNNQAVAVGPDSTYGKGSIQSVFKLHEGGLKVTVALYYTPKGRSIEKEKGLKPDVHFKGKVKHFDTFKARMAHLKEDPMLQTGLKILSKVNQKRKKSRKTVSAVISRMKRSKKFL